MHCNVYVFAALCALGACSSKRDDDGRSGLGSGSGSGGPSVGLKPVVELRPRAVLVEGTRRIGVWAGDRDWYEADARGLAVQPLVGAAMLRTKAELGELVDIFLGASPILSGGAEHQEQVWRFSPTAKAVELHGMLVQVATAHSANAPIELWRYEHELRTQLATIDAAGVLTALPQLPRVGPPDPGRSPVSAKACAAPKVRDIAGIGDTIFALVTECHSSAPVRIAAYRWPGPAVAITTLGTLAELDLQIDRLVASRTGPILVGRRGDVLAIVRIGPGGKLSSSVSLAGIETVTHAAVADDGAVWTRSLGRGSDGRDHLVIARDGKPVQIANAAGTALRPESVAFDEQLGIVVLALDGTSHWLLAERAPATPPATLPARM